MRRPHGRSALSLALLAGGVLVTTSALADAPPPDAGRILREQQSAQPQALRRLSPQQTSEDPKVDGDGDAMEDVDTGPRVLIREIRIEGGEGLGMEKLLSELIETYTGRDLSFGGMQGLADRINRQLRLNGWLLTRAILPPQDLTDGRLQITIESARLQGARDGSGIEIARDSGVRLDAARASRTVGRAVFGRSESSVNEADLERAMLILGDLPGLQARSILGPGQMDGTGALKVELKQGPALRGSVWADNYGNRFTGRDRGLSAQLDIRDPLGWGDQVSLTGTVAEGTTFGRVGYAAPLGYSGLVAGLYASTLDYEIRNDPLEARGTASGWGGSLSYPFIRSRESNFTLSAGFDRRDLSDDSRVGNLRDKQIDNWSISLSGDRQDLLGGGGLTNIALSVTRGRLDLSGNPDDQLVDASTVKTAGRFTRATATVARLQRVTDQFSVFATINAQQASKNLDSAEKFFLGGPAGVRAYPMGEGAGDSGHLLNIEARLDLKSLGVWGLGEWQGVLFYDSGVVRLQEEPFAPAFNATGSNRYRLSGAGLGLVLTSAGKYTLRVAWAKAIGDNPGRSILDGSNSDGLTRRSQWWLYGQVGL